MENNYDIFGDNSQYTVLAVDDNPKNLQLISLTLKSYGYKIALANNGENALKYLEIKKPDLILLDIMMPEMDGYELCKIIKENPATYEIPLIFLTARTESEDLVKGFNYGAVDYLVKPFKPEELSIRVKTHIKLKKSIEIILQKNSELESLNALLMDTQNKIVRDAQRLSFLNEALIDSEKKLIDLNSSKDKFFSIIAHDIKSPLSGLISLLNYINIDFDNWTKEELQEFIEATQKSAQNVHKMLEDVLDWSRFQLSFIDIKPELILIHGVVDLIIQQVSTTFSSKALRFFNNVPNDAFINADMYMISTILRNILSNSAKFSNSNSHIEINYDLKDKVHQISIVDHGIGIPNNIMKSLFLLDQKSVRKGTFGESGSGLGLIMAKEFVEKHSGKLWIESKEFEGTTVNFTIPD